MNKNDFTPLLTAGKSKSDTSPLVSICIPARNEEDVIARAVKSALRQDYPNLEILVLDDQSTDTTGDILTELKINNQELLSIINGKNKPAKWLGKSWACHQLSQRASGELLLFLDADAWLDPRTVRRSVRSMGHHSVDFITVWPIQKLGTFWEKVVIPIIYYGLLTLLPAKYVRKKPNWLPSSFQHHFAAACGQYMVFKSDVYKKIGGHQSVKNQIVEDVALARQIKKQGHRMRMYHGEGTVYCRMYTSELEMWQGFRKNFLALYNNSVIAFCFMAVLNFVVYVFPFLILPIALLAGYLSLLLLSLSAIALIYLHRFIIDHWFHWSLTSTLTHPLGVLWFLRLGVRVLRDYFQSYAPEWKNRSTTVTDK